MDGDEGYKEGHLSSALQEWGRLARRAKLRVKLYLKMYLFIPLFVISVCMSRERQRKRDWGGKVPCIPWHMCGCQFCLFTENLEIKLRLSRVCGKHFYTLRSYQLPNCTFYHLSSEDAKSKQSTGKSHQMSY